MRKAILLCLALLLLGVAPVMAADGTAPVQGDHKAETSKGPSQPGDSNLYIVIAIGFGLAIAVFGGALGQSRAISASVEAMARQPEAGGRIFGAMFLGLALIESLVIYMWVTTFLLLGKFH